MRWSVFLVKPETVLDWHRRMVAPRWTYRSTSKSGPPAPDEVGQLLRRDADVAVGDSDRDLVGHSTGGHPYRLPSGVNIDLRRTVACG
jgi:hypothetical protein